MTSEEAVKIVKKNDAPYLNSKARVAKKILISLLEYVVIILLTLMLASYMESGTIDNMFNMNESMMEMLQPGGFIFNSLVAYLPILILVNLSSYFGSGSKAKLLIGVLKCVAIALWLTVLLDSAATSIEIPSIAEGQHRDRHKGSCQVRHIHSARIHTGPHRGIYRSIQEAQECD